MTGIYDAVQNDSLGQGIHQPVVQLIINDLSCLQVDDIVQVVNAGQHSNDVQCGKLDNIVQVVNVSQHSHDGQVQASPEK